MNAKLVVAFLVLTLTTVALAQTPAPVSPKATPKAVVTTKSAPVVHAVATKTAVVAPVAITKATTKPATKAAVPAPVVVTGVVPIAVATPAAPKVTPSPKAGSKIETKTKTETKTETKIETKIEIKPPVDPNDLGGIIKHIMLSAKTGKWALLVGFVIMLLTWLVNRVLKQKIPTKVLPWLAMGLSTLSSFIFALATGAMWIDALVSGVQNGLVAAGGWSAFGKYIPGMTSTSPPDEKPIAPATPVTPAQPIVPTP